MLMGSRFWFSRMTLEFTPTLVPRFDTNGLPVYVNSSDPSADFVFRPRVDANGRPDFCS